MGVYRKNLSVLVTGSSRGIGRAIALELGRNGYSVVLHCRASLDKTQLVHEELSEIGVDSRILQFDLANREACQKILEQDIEKNGIYYGVVCNAGIVADNAFPAMSPSEWDSVIRTDLDSFYNVLHPLVMPMVRSRKPGRIITIASVSALIGNRGQVNYSAAKAGIVAASKSLALELAKRAITVNCVAPGIIETDMTEEILNIEDVLKMIPLGRAGAPEEVASLISYLMSEQASYITRQVISINGGLC